MLIKNWNSYYVVLMFSWMYAELCNRQGKIYKKKHRASHEQEKTQQIYRN